MLRVIFPLLCVCALVVVGCQTEQATTPQPVPAAPEQAAQPVATPQQAPQPAATPSAADANASEEVLASVGDQQLTMKHIRWRQPNPSDAQIAWLADSWIETVLLCEEADRRGLTGEPRVQFLAEMMRKGAIASELKRRVSNSVEVTEEMIRQYYDENRQRDRRLSKPGYLGFSHVRTATQEEAQSVLEKVKGGANINELAEKLSIDRDAREQGKVQRASERTIAGRFGKDFLKALKAAKVGEVIGPIEVEDKGVYEVAVKESQVDPEPRPLERVRAYIEARLRRQLASQAVGALVERLQKENADRITKSPRLIEAEKAAEATARSRRSSTRARFGG